MDALLKTVAGGDGDGRFVRMRVVAQGSDLGP